MLIAECSYCYPNVPDLPPPDDHWRTVHAVAELGKVRYLAATGQLTDDEVETLLSWEHHPALERRDRARAVREGFEMAATGVRAPDLPTPPGHPRRG